MSPQPPPVEVDHSSQLKLRRMSADLVTGLLIIVVAAAGLVMLVNYFLTAKKENQALRQEAGQYLSYLSNSLELPIWSLDDNNIKQIADAFMAVEEVSLIEVTDPSDQKILYSKKTPGENDLVIRHGTVNHNDQRIGTIHLGLSKTPSRHILHRLLYTSLLITAVITIAMAAAAGLLLRLFVYNPLHSLMGVASEMARGNYDCHIQKIAHHEIAIVYQQLMTMAARVKEREASLADANRQLQEQVERRKNTERALRKSELRYRNIFDTVSISLWEEDYSAIETAIDNLKARGIHDIGDYLHRHPEFVQHAASLVQVIDVNKETLKLYKAKDKEELLPSLEKILSAESMPAFTDVLIAIANGERYFEFESINHTLEGDKIHIFARQTLPGRIDGFSNSILSIMDITENKRAEKALRESEKRYRLLFENANDAIFLYRVEKDGTSSNILDANKVASTRYGYGKNELLQMEPTHLDAPELASGLKRNLSRLADGIREVFETVHITKNGARIPVEVGLKGFEIDGDLFSIAVVRDITESKQTEKRLIQSQKMEAIGALAGGIAHDFNNILSPIIGYSEILMATLDKNSASCDHVKKIFSSANRAGQLVQQILTFSRSSDTEKKPIKMQPIVKEVLALIRSTIPATIEINQFIDNTCGLVMADPIQIHQVVMNLITNAYHAILKSEGRLNIRLERAVLETMDLSDSSRLPGEYACLTLEDSGHGMDPHTLSQIFDPYFTTKQVGKGTGLGLAVVHGIVKELGGEIKVYSEVGHGSVFRVYVPIIVDDYDHQKFDCDGPLTGGQEHILIVDDEQMIVDMEKSMLEKMGYQVTARTSSIEALYAFEASPDKFDLVISDMTMPQMTGLQLSKGLKKIRHDIKIVLCTGFSEQLNEKTAHQLHLDGFIMKPVIMAELLNLIRKVLDQ